MKFNIFIFFLLTLNLNAKELIPYLSGEKYGYADIDGNIILQPKYDEADFFEKEGIAHVRQDKHWSVINKKGILLLPFVSEEKPKLSLVFSTSCERGNIKKVDTLNNLRQFVWFDKHSQKNNTKEHQLYKRPDSYIYIINVETPNDSISAYLIENNEMRSRICMPNYPVFYYGYFIGKTKSGNYQVINNNGKIVISCKNKPTLWNSKYLSYPIDGSTIIVDLFTGEIHEILFQTIHENINNEFLIVSDKEVDNSGIFSFNPRNPPPKKGLIDFNSNIIIDTIYKRLYWYGDNLIAKNEYACIIDFNGNKISSKEYKSILKLSPAYYKAKTKDNKLAILNPNGQKAIKRVFDKIQYYHHYNYYTWTLNDTAGVLDSNLMEVINYPSQELHRYHDSDYFIFSINRKVGLMRKDKSVILKPDYEYFSITKDSFIIIKKDGKDGLTDLNGKILFEPIFDNFSVEEHNGQIYFWPYKNGYYACFNEKLEQLADFNCRFASISSKPLDWEHRDGKYYLTNQYGSPIGISSNTSFYGNYVEEDSTYVILFEEDDNPYAILPDGNFISDTPNKKSILTDVNIKCGLFGIQKDSLEGVLNHKNEQILPLTNKKIYNITDELIITFENSKHFFYDHSGNLIHNYGYDDISGSAIKNLSAVSNNVEGKTYMKAQNICNSITDSVERKQKKYGFIDVKGNLIVPLEYDHYHGYYDDYACVSMGYIDGDKTSYLIDSLGNIVLEVLYDYLYPCGKSDNSKFYIARNKDKTGLINIKGEVIFPIQYNAISPFNAPEMYLVRDTNMIWHLINISGKIIYSDVDLNGINHNSFFKLPNNRLLVFSNGNSEVIDRNGNKYKKIKDQNVKIIEKNNIQFLEVANTNKKYYINAETLVEYREESD